MLRFLTVLGLTLSLSAEGKIPENSKNIIKLGVANGLKAVNETGEPDGPQFRDKTGLSYYAPKGIYVPNPENYQGEITNKIPEYFFRTVRDCKSNEILSEQVIFTYNGYKNYIGGSRYHAQCVLDGSTDSYYEETTERMR